MSEYVPKDPMQPGVRAKASILQQLSWNKHIAKEQIDIVITKSSV